MNEREQIINFLLKSCDDKSQTIAQLQGQIADLQKQLVSKSEATKG